MNIFILDESPRLAAVVQHDRHVVKMILESAQMLSMAVHESADLMDMMPHELRPLLYKPTHKNHPASVWTRESPANFVWLVIHADALCGEYTRRFRKVHKSYDLIRGFKQIARKLAGADRFDTRDANRCHVIDSMILGLANQHTPFVYCGPTWHDTGKGVIEAYREYYVMEKCHNNRWSLPPSRVLPGWIAPHATVFDRYPTRVANPPAKPHVPTGMAIPSFLRK